MAVAVNQAFELDDLEMTVLPGGSAEPVIHFPAVFVVFYWMVPV